jgi:hypothetical protein
MLYLHTIFHMAYFQWFVIYHHQKDDKRTHGHGFPNVIFTFCKKRPLH